MDSQKGLLLNLISNRETVLDAIQMHYLTNPKIRPVGLERQLEELNKSISNIEQSCKI